MARPGSCKNWRHLVSLDVLGNCSVRLPKFWSLCLRCRWAASSRFEHELDVIMWHVARSRQGPAALNVGDTHLAGLLCCAILCSVVLGCARFVVGIEWIGLQRSGGQSARRSKQNLVISTSYTKPPAATTDGATVVAEGLCVCRFTRVLLTSKQDSRLLTCLPRCLLRTASKKSLTHSPTRKTSLCRKAPDLCERVAP